MLKFVEKDPLSLLREIQTGAMSISDLMVRGVAGSLHLLLGDPHVNMLLGTPVWGEGVNIDIHRKIVLSS